MQTLKSLLAGCWAFSLAFNSTTVESTSLFNICVRFAVKGRLVCFHFIAMPLVGRHAGQNMFDAFIKVVDVVMPHWRDTLFSISSDGARNMTGRDQGIVSLIAKAISPDRTILRTWCGAHQIDLVFQMVVSKLCDGEFYTTLTSLISLYLQTQI